MSSESGKIKIWVSGSEGRMGHEIRQAIESKSNQFEYVGGSDANVPCSDILKTNAEVVLDFSTIQGNLDLLSWLKKNNVSNKSILIGTTGLSEDQKKSWSEYASSNNSKVLITSNTSLGVLLLVKILNEVSKQLADQGFDIEVLETHHRDKVDAPSGTAKLLAESILKTLPGYELSTERDHKRKPNEIGIQALRGGKVFGEHEIRFLGDNEEITLSHRALSRGLFANGSLVLAQWLAKQKNGFYTTFDIQI